MQYPPYILDLCKFTPSSLSPVITILSNIRSISVRPALNINGKAKLISVALRASGMEFLNEIRFHMEFREFSP
jgi:hypothetical protein